MATPNHAMRAFTRIAQSSARLTRPSPIPSSRRRCIHSRRQPHDAATAAERPSTGSGEAKGAEMEAGKVEGSRSSSSSSSQPGEQALPAPGAASGPVLDVSGQGTRVKLDELGPLVVNTNGTVGRVANWRGMTAMEKETTLRLLGKRNKARLEALQGKGSGESNQ